MATLNLQVQDAGAAAQAGLNSGGCIFGAAAFFMGVRDRVGFDAVRMSAAQQEKIMRYWLMKSEPDEASIEHALAAPDHTLPWTGVRNYQARNFMRDAMRVGDGVLFYHSSCAEPGIAGLAEVASTPYPDPTQFDPASPYYDPKSDREHPRWLLVDVRATTKTRLISLPALREHAELTGMIVLRKGNRLSITPVTPDEWRFITTSLLKGS